MAEYGWQRFAKHCTGLKCTAEQHKRIQEYSERVLLFGRAEAMIWLENERSKDEADKIRSDSSD